MATPLGSILLRRGMITEAQLNRALSDQRKHGGRLGDILVAGGVTGYYPLYQAIAEHYGLPFVNLLKEPPESALLQGLDPEACLRHKALPWKKKDGKLILAVADMSEDTAAWARKLFGENIDCVFTSPFDIRRTVELHFSKALDTASRLSLWKSRPQQSARVTLPPKQKQIVYALAIIAFAVTLFFPIRATLAFIAFSHIAYGVTMAFKCLVFARGASSPTAWPWQQHLAVLDERTLPVYTVLVPMYKEASSLPGLLAAIERFDYPKAKLDVKLVLEADDKETLNAALALKPHYHFDIIRVPASQPRTKPKACNYALRFARGEFVTVFDADDIPDKLQLKKAIIAFRTLPPDVVCLQARLNYYNAHDNLLTRFFSLEYTVLFHFMLYGLSRLDIPIPLGGTSNHIYLSRLKELGEWDPFNVTEDADLGTRLAARGWRTDMLDSFTMEEAPNQLMPWIRQRSRWIKGYMQTWLVHMRHPVNLYRTLGWRGFLGFQCFIGLSCFTFLTAPIVWLMSLLWVGSVAQLHHTMFPQWLLWLALANLALNFITHWYLSLYSAWLYRRYNGEMVTAAVLYPLYLVLHSIASYRAFWQLIVKPHLWEKTTHGLCKYADAYAQQQEVVQPRLKP